MKIKEWFLNKIDLIITVSLAVAAFMLFIFSFIVDEPFKSLFIHLVAGFIGSIITIWGIEFWRKKKFEMKWGKAKDVAKEDIIQLRNKLVSYIGGPMGFQFTQYGSTEEILGSRSEEIVKAMVDDINSHDFDEILNKLSIDQWNSFQVNLPLIRLSLFEGLQLYKEILPPEILGQLLRVNRIFNRFYFTFGFVPDLFTKDEDYWPINKGGIKKNREIRAGLIKSLAKDLKDYFEKIDILIDLLRKTRF